MKVKKLCSGFFFVLALISSLQAKEQNIRILNNVLTMNVNSVPQNQDSTEVFTIDSLDLERIMSIRTVFEKQNSTYSTPQAPGEKLLLF
jgi:hypothetical protein